MILVTEWESWILKQKNGPIYKDIIDMELHFVATFIVNNTSIYGFVMA